MQAEVPSRVVIASVDYRGWRNSYRITNGLIEVVIAPRIGRIMRFAWINGGNVLWEDESLDGTRHGVDAEGWANFGGDKVWPSPQSDWEKLTERPWPPPEAFDSVPYKAEQERSVLVITSPVDRYFGIETVRRIALAEREPVLKVSTEFRKVSGAPVRTGIWVITQMCDPERVTVLLPKSIQGASCVPLMGATPRDMVVDGRLLSLTRDRQNKIKVGTKGTSLLWIGKDDVVRIDAAEAEGEFPDQGSRTEIYTNSDPLPYVELETMAPLVTMKVGDSAEWTNTYTLSRRSCATSAEEARQIFQTK